MTISAAVGRGRADGAFSRPRGDEGVDLDIVFPVSSVAVADLTPMPLSQGAAAGGAVLAAD